MWFNISDTLSRNVKSLPDIMIEATANSGRFAFMIPLMHSESTGTVRLKYRIPLRYSNAIQEISSSFAPLEQMHADTSDCRVPEALSDTNVAAFVNQWTYPCPHHASTCRMARQWIIAFITFSLKTLLNVPAVATQVVISPKICRIDLVTHCFKTAGLQYPTKRRPRASILVR